MVGENLVEEGGTAPAGSYNENWVFDIWHEYLLTRLMEVKFFPIVGSRIPGVAFCTTKQTNSSSRGAGAFASG